jgi:hypothetical protein
VPLDGVRQASWWAIPENFSGIKVPRRPQLAGKVGNVFLLRTAPISSVPTEISHTASAAMLGQFTYCSDRHSSVLGSR